MQGSFEAALLSGAPSPAPAERLPLDLVTHVLTFIPVLDQAAACSRTWRAAADAAAATSSGST